MSNNNLLLKNLVYLTPLPSSISLMWNFGFLLGICLIIQIISGLFLSFHYIPSLDMAFESVMDICEEVNGGWVVRSIHANGASLFFICIFIHIGRGMINKSFNFFSTWFIGVLILLILMGTAFLGYVLPWGQMSLWGATVITNLLSAVPFFGEKLVEWVWGGFSVSEPTLERFFSLHFLLPFLILVLVVFHIMMLHFNGSSNPLGLDLNSDKVSFFPFYFLKDFLILLTFFFTFTCIVLQVDLFMDPENFSMANPLSTPPHIQPEWYFLFAYAILRSVPNKLGGVVALVFSILILLLLPLSSSSFFIFKKNLVWIEISLFFLLTWIGMMPVEYPFSFLGQIMSILYFVIFFIIVIL